MPIVMKTAFIGIQLEYKHTHLDLKRNKAEIEIINTHRSRVSEESWSHISRSTEIIVCSSHIPSPSEHINGQVRPCIHRLTSFSGYEALWGVNASI